MRIFPYHLKEIAFRNFNKFAVADGEDRCRSFVVEQKGHIADEHVVRRHDGNELASRIDGVTSRYDKEKVGRRLVLTANDLFVGVRHRFEIRHGLRHRVRFVDSVGDFEYHLIAFFVVRDFRNELRRETDAPAVQFSVGHVFIADIFSPIETVSFVLNRYGRFLFSDRIRDRNLLVRVSRIGGALRDEAEYISCLLYTSDAADD